MPTIAAPTTIVMRACLLSIAADNYEKTIGKVTLTPNVPVAKYKGIDGTVIQDVGAAEWTLQLDYVQDHSTANSLTKYLLANAGQTKTIVLSPYGSTTGKPKYTIDVTILPGPLGGDVDKPMTGSVALPCTGQPVPATWP